MSALRTITSGPGFPESPRWRDGKLWYVEFFSRTVRRTDIDGNEEIVAQLEAMPGGLGFLPDGTPLVVSQNDFRILRIGRDGSLAVHADLSGHCRGAANDMFVDDAGRAYVGHHGFDFFGKAEPQPASLVMVEPGGTVREVADDLVFPNGIAAMPGGTSLVVAESFAKRLTIFDIARDGALENRRTFAQFDDHTPDGICSDSAGGVWFGSPMTAAFARVGSDGSITDTIPTTDGRWGVACTLGGEGGRTLFTVTAATTPETMPQGKSEAFVEMIEVETAGT
jgi:sugar lactone lactonase YvrE